LTTEEPQADRQQHGETPRKAEGTDREKDSAEDGRRRRRVGLAGTAVRIDVD